MCIGGIWAGDMTLIMDNNQAVILHEDNTWEFKDRNLPDLTKDVYLGLNDNRTIKVGADYSWKFVGAAELSSNENIAPDSVSAKGSANHIGLPEAKAIALNNAVEKATGKFQTAVKQKKLDYKKLKECIRRVEKDIDYEQNFVTGRGWSVSAKVLLDKGSILAVLECVNPPKPPKAAEGEKKEGEKKGAKKEAKSKAKTEPKQ
jgi:hypothetical protein